MVKRLMDLLIAGMALLLLWPLGVLIALAIKLDSPGAVFFRQERVGRHGRTFRIHKFRTMRLDAPEAGPALTVGDDARITRVGRWLRGRRFDEWPQLLDVLAGHMSLVGPRPEVPRFVAHYPQALRSQVLAVRPGMTDPASLAHLDESAWLSAQPDPERAYIEQILPAKLALQARYAASASFRSDLAVLVQTLARLAARPRM